MEEKKQRTRKEVDAEYTNHAVLAGHKSRILAQMTQDAMKIEEEIDGHVKKMLELNEEGMKLPAPEQPKEVPAQTPPGAA